MNMGQDNNKAKVPVAFGTIGNKNLDIINQNEVNQNEVNQNEVNQNEVNQNEVNQEPINQEPINQEPINQEPINYNNSVIHKAISHKNDSKDKVQNSVEKFVGSILMGIFASIFIIAGLILLVTAESEFINDNIKVIVLFAVSFVILFAGLIGNIKRKNSFFTSLSGCGVGAVYISIFMSYAYFHIINAVMVIGIAVVWSIIVNFIGARSSIIFNIIGQCGLLVTLCFGLDCMNDFKQAELFWLILSVIYICNTVFLYLIDNKRIAGTVTALIINLLAYVFMCNSFISVMDKYLLWQQLLLLGILLLYSFWLNFAAYMKFGRIKEVSSDMTSTEVLKEKALVIEWVVYFGFNTLLSSIFIIITYQFDYAPGWMLALIGIFYLTILWIFIGLRKREDLIFIICSAIIFLFYIVFIKELGIVNSLFGVGLIAVPILLIAIASKSRKMMLFSLAALFAFSFHQAEYLALYSLLMMLLILSNSLAVYMCKKFDFYLFKIAILVSILIFIVRAANIFNMQYDILKDYAYSIAYAICVLILFALLINNNKAREEKKLNYQSAFHTSLIVFNAIAMVEGSFLAFEAENVYFKMAYLVFLMLAVLVNVPIANNKKDAMFDIYNGIKLTMFCVIALITLEVENYLITLACLIVSITAIAIGLKNKRKPIRIYGLVLAVICILKLIFIDISFDNNLERALAVLGCGVLTFCICFVYNLADKKANQLEKAESSIYKEQNFD